MNAATFGPRRAAAATALAGAAIWLLTHQYIGLGGDGSLYAMMAMNRATPGLFSSDLFLRLGSQDAYTVLTPLYGWLIGAGGLLKANVGLLFAAYILWLAGAWLLSHRLLRGWPAHFAYLAVCAMPLTYGGFSFLTAGEPYLTPRPFAEALTLIGLAFAVSRQWFRSAAAMTLAAAFHPIMALAGFGAVFVLAVMRRPALALVAPLGAAMLLVLALTGIAPFDRLLLIMDRTWFGAVELRDPFVLSRAWSAVDWTRLVCDLAPCVAAAMWTRGRRRGLFAASALAAIGAVALSLVGGDAIHDALIVQLQLGRCGWLPAVVQLIALVALWFRLRRAPYGRLIVALLAAPTLILGLEFQRLAWPAALAFSLGGLGLAIWRRTGRGGRLDPGLERRLFLAVAILPLACLGIQATLMWRAAALTTRLHLALPGEPDLLPARLALLVGAGWVAWMATRRRWVAWIAIVVTFGLGTMTWDARTPWETLLTSGRTLAILPDLPRGGALLWGTDAADVWFLAHRPAYVSETQSAGLLFSRPTAIEWLRRRAVAAPVLALGAWGSGGENKPCAETRPAIEAAKARAVCLAAPDLAGMVLDRPPAGLTARQFTTPAAMERLCTAGARFGVARTSHFFFIPCAPLRAP